MYNTIINLIHYKYNTLFILLISLLIFFLFLKIIKYLKEIIGKMVEQKYIIVTVGPTGSGKSSGVVKKVCMQLGIKNITSKDQKILIDNLIVADPYYKHRISNILKYKYNCGISPIEPWKRNINKQNKCEDKFKNGTNLYNYNAFEESYITTRNKISGCSKELNNRKGENCNAINDNKFLKCLLENKNIVFETTGYNKKGSLTPAWFINNGLSASINNISLANLLNKYKIVFVYSFVKYKELKRRNLKRGYETLRKYIQNVNVNAPRIININNNIFKPKIKNIIKNLKILNKNIINKSRLYTQHNIVHDVNNWSLMIFDNNGDKGEEKLIYNSENTRMNTQTFNNFVNMNGYFG